MGSPTGARILLAIGFLAAMLGYQSYLASRTVLDPNATTALARELLATSTVQDSLDKQLRTQVEETLDHAGGDPEVATAVRLAVHDPRVVDAFAEALHTAHAALLADSNGSVTLDGRALTTAVSNALAPLDPELAAELSSRPPLQVELDGDELRTSVTPAMLPRTVAWLGAVAALLLVAASLLLVHDRRAIARVGRRIAYLGIVPLFVFALVPGLFGGGRGTPQEVVVAALRAYGGRVVPSAIALVVLGVVIATAATLAPRPAHDDEAVGPPPPPEPRRQPVPADVPRVEERLYL